MAKKKTAPSESPAVPSATPAPASPARARKAPARQAKSDSGTRANSTAPELSSASDLSSGLHAASPSWPSYEQIAEAAYHRFLQRGGIDGNAFEDWIEAERQLRGGQ